jgi:hypothetical protein
MYDPPKINQKDTNYWNRSIMNNGIEIVIKNFPKRKIPGPGGFTAEFY